jgi:pyridoxal phosphate enzyme (YggS family)
MPHDGIARNLDSIRRRIHAAADRAGRLPASVTLVAVSKTFGPDDVRAAADAGQRVFGENRVQEAGPKMDALADLDLEWHLIGHLQSNKARKAAQRFAWVESIDSIDLLKKVDQAVADLGVRRSILLQVDLAGEATKHGADAVAIRDLANAAVDCRALDLRGLMLVPPVPAAPEDSRAWFRQLRELRDTLTANGVPAAHLRDLSMGMSHDFEVAIEEGATLIRVGSAIFGTRPPA